MKWRLTLDPPYTFALEPENIIPKHCQDFNPAKSGLTKLYRDPLTGVVMLRPTVFGPDWYQGLQALTQWRTTSTPGYWNEVKRTGDGALLMSLQWPSDKTNASVASLIDLDTKIAKIVLEVTSTDTLIWSAESNFHLEGDESFAIHYRGLCDDLIRKHNLFAVQWDQYFLHMSGTGKLRLYKYADRTKLADAPTLIYERSLGMSGEMLHRDGYMVLIPMPGLGILVQHYLQSPDTSLVQSNTAFSAGRGLLLPVDAYADKDGIQHVYERTPVRLALNPYHQHLVGLARVTFESSGTFIDGLMEVTGYKPSELPTAQAVPLEGLKQTISVSYRKADDTADWEVGDAQGRFKAVLTTDDTKYTPFLYGYVVGFPSVEAVRNTTPIVLGRKRGTGKQDSLQYLEWSEDEYARYEGKATLLIETTAGRWLAERGDSTFVLEYSSDGTTWAALFGGLAKQWVLTPVITNNGFHYEAEVVLCDIWERFREWALMFAGKFDALDIGTAINLILRAVGLPAFTPPAEMTAKKLPPIRVANAWRFQPREGDKGDEMIRNMLLFMRGQGVEWRMPYNWDTALFSAEQKPRDTTNYWQAVPAYNDPRATAAGLPAVSEASRVFRYGEGTKLRPHPPEFNTFQVEGLTGPTPGPDTYRILSDPVKNIPSFNDPTSPDYLGRIVPSMYAVWPISDQQEIDRMARRIYDLGAHRSFEGNIACPDFMASLRPAVCLYLLDNLGNPYPRANSALPDGVLLWVKRRTVIADMDDKETMTLAVDSVWEGDLK